MVACPWWHRKLRLQDATAAWPTLRLGVPPYKAEKPDALPQLSHIFVHVRRRCVSLGRGGGERDDECNRRVHRSVEGVETGGRKRCHWTQGCAQSWHSRGEGEYPELQVLSEMPGVRRNSRPSPVRWKILEMMDGPCRREFWAQGVASYAARSRTWQDEETTCSGDERRQIGAI